MEDSFAQQRSTGTSGAGDIERRNLFVHFCEENGITIIKDERFDMPILLSLKIKIPNRREEMSFSFASDSLSKTIIESKVLLLDTEIVFLNGKNFRFDYQYGFDEEYHRWKDFDNCKLFVTWLNEFYGQ